MTSRRAAKALFVVVLTLLGVACGGSSGSPLRAKSAKSTEVDLAQPTTNDGAATTEGSGAWGSSATPGASSNQVPVDGRDAVWGAGDAPVTVMIFTDFQCPFCSRAHPRVAQLMREYGPKRLRVVFKHYPLPFHQDAGPAAMAAQAVYQVGGASAFFAYVDLLFQGQSQLSDANLLSWGAQVGVDRSTLIRVATSKETQAKIDADLALAQRLGVRGTPAFLINGDRVVGAQPYEAFKERVDRELAVAQKLRDKGVAPSGIYAARVAENFRAPEPDGEGDAPAPRKAAALPDTTLWKVPLAKSPTLGPADALVTLVEFSDYECPYCKKAHKTVDELLRRYPGKLRVVFKHQPLPFHKRALPAAHLAMEARAQRGDKGFWEATKLIFEASPQLEDDDLMAIARQMKLNEARVKAALSKETHKAAIEADGDLAEDVGARGTPTFYVNGKKLSGAQPIEKFEALIGAELSAATAKVSAGTPATRLYADLIAGGASGKPLELATSTPAVDKKNPSKGPAKAAVTVQVFSDFQCPFCSRVVPTLAQIEKQYAGRVRIVWRNSPLPFHQDARPAAMAAMEAFAQQGDAGFWKMHDLLFANQSSLDQASLEGYGRKIGLDTVKLRAALAGGVHESALVADEAAAKAAGASGTPSFVINGYAISGAQPLRAFKKVIDRALEDAKLGRAAAP
ncbi:MAG: thioredoxin domain-containing protein [Myxococcales bacterium]|nr:thioredoxin domain-containing protein [Myxococcales bacterium]